MVKLLPLLKEMQQTQIEQMTKYFDQKMEGLPAVKPQPFEFDIEVIPIQE